MRYGHVPRVDTKGAQNLPIPFETPATKDVVASSFGFAEELLASQKTFAEQIVAASAPVFETGTQKKQ